MSRTGTLPGWKDWLLVLALACVVLLPGISSIPPVDRDESRYAVATTQMLDSGDYIDIRFQDQPRYLQPAGIYWLQSITAGLTGASEARAIGGYRLPSFLAMLATIGMTLALTSHAFGRRAGIVAALLLATSFAIGFEARIAKTDAVLLATITAAHFALMRIYLQPAGSWWRPALFWAALGAGVMIKGPIIGLFIGLTLLALALWDRRLAWMKALKPLWGLPLFLAIVLPWYIAIGIHSDGQFYMDAVGQNLLGKVGESQQSHAGPPGYYAGVFSLMFWPASLFVVMAGHWAWTRRREAAVRYLIAWAVPGWLVYELIATKLPHYVMPTYPALAVLAAAAALAPRQTAPVWVRIAAAIYLLVWLAASALMTGLGAALTLWSEDRLSPVLIAVGVIAFIAAAAAAGLWVAGRRLPALAAGIAAGAISLPVAFGTALPALDQLWMTPRIVAAVEAVRPCDDSVLVTSTYREPSLVFAYGPYNTLLVDGADAVAAQMAQDRSCAIALIEAREEAAFLARAAELGLTLRAADVVEGTNYSNGDEQVLTVYIPGEG